jgi:hypothetical protein
MDLKVRLAFTPLTLFFPSLWELLLLLSPNSSQSSMEVCCASLLLTFSVVPSSRAESKIKNLLIDQSMQIILSIHQSHDNFKV